MSRAILYTVIGIVLAAILSVSLTAVSAAVSRSERQTNDVCSDEDVDSLKNDLEKACNFSAPLVVRYRVVTIDCDSFLSKEETEREPNYVGSASGEGTISKPIKDDRTYFLFMVDPDAPLSSLDLMTFYLHWAVSNIKGEAIKDGNIAGKTLLEYRVPSPPNTPDETYHRYQFILFEEQTESDFSIENYSTAEFKLGDFMTKENLCTYVGIFEFRVKTPEYA